MRSAECQKRRKLQQSCCWSAGGTKPYHRRIHGGQCWNHPSWRWSGHIGRKYRCWMHPEVGYLAGNNRCWRETVGVLSQVRLTDGRANCQQPNKASTPIYQFYCNFAGILHQPQDGGTKSLFSLVWQQEISWNGWNIVEWCGMNVHRFIVIQIY